VKSSLAADWLCCNKGSFVGCHVTSCSEIDKKCYSIAPVMAFYLNFKMVEKSILFAWLEHPMCWKCDAPLCWDLHGQRRHTTPNLQFSDQPSTPTAGSPFNCRVLVLGHDWCVNLVASKWWKAWFLKQDEANPSRAVSKFSPPWQPSARLGEQGFRFS
jgi:hypothetical protein